MVGKARVKMWVLGIPDIIKFTDIESGQGVVKGGEVWLKVGTNKYLHFYTISSEVDLLESFLWPENLFGEVKKFRLIAEEI